MKLRLLLIISGLLVCLNVKANWYMTANAGYMDAESGDAQASAESFKITLATEIHPQWDIELSGQTLAKSDFGEFQIDPSADLGMKGYSLGVAMLGKAANRTGELFYRLGVQYVDAEWEALSGTDGCGSDLAVCVLDDSRFAGVIGVGFDTKLTRSWFVRIEAEYLRGEDDFSAGAGYIGLRYQF